MSNSATWWTTAHQASLSFTISWSLLKFMSIESVMLMLSTHLILCCSLLLLPSIFPSIGSQRVRLDWATSLFPASRSSPMSWLFVSGGQSIESFSISPSSEYSGLIFFKIDWFDLAVQGTPKSLLQHPNLKASILQPSAFYIVQLSHPYMTTEKTITLTRQIFAGKVMSLLFNMLSRFVIAFPPKIRHLLISWLQCLSTVILEPRKIKSVTVSTVSPCICHEVMGPDAMILVFWTLNFKPAFSLSYFTLIKCSLVPLHFLSLERLSVQFSSVQFSCSVVSNSLRAHESQHTRPPCPWPTPGVDSNSCPSSRWCHPAISSSVVPFSFWSQSLPASESFPMSQLFTSGGQSNGVSASALVLPMNNQDWSPLGWTGWIFL